MVQPYPSAPQLPQLPQRPPVPDSVRRAVMAMYIGAVTELIRAVLTIVTAGSLKAIIARTHPTMTAQVAHSYDDLLLIIEIIGSLIACGLFVWIALECRYGRNWARIVGTVLFGLGAFGALVGVGIASVPLDQIWAFVPVLAGLVAVILLWQGTSSDYFTPRIALDPTARPQSP
jgi:hypothetical protein